MNLDSAIAPSQFCVQPQRLLQLVVQHVVPVIRRRSRQQLVALLAVQATRRRSRLQLAVLLAVPAIRNNFC
jgi:hypothetical protein